MWFEVLRRRMMWHGVIDKALCCWGVWSKEDIPMVYWNMRNDSSVVDEVYIKRGCLVLEDFLFFSLYSRCCIAKQARLWNSTDLYLGLSPSIQTSKSLDLITISHYCYQYDLQPSPPITVERVFTMYLTLNVQSTPFDAVLWSCLVLVLATGPGNPPVVQVFPWLTVHFSSRTTQQPDLLCLGGVVTRTWPTQVVFWPGFILQRSFIVTNTELLIQLSSWVQI